jgi:hypothetical protein
MGMVKGEDCGQNHSLKTKRLPVSHDFSFRYETYPDAPWVLVSFTPAAQDLQGLLLRLNVSFSASVSLNFGQFGGFGLQQLEFRLQPTFVRL